MPPVCPAPRAVAPFPRICLLTKLEYGVIPRLGWSGADDAVLCHQGDFAGCVNPTHMRLGTNAANRREYTRRRRNITSQAVGGTFALTPASRSGLWWLPPESAVVALGLSLHSPAFCSSPRIRAASEPPGLSTHAKASAASGRRGDGDGETVFGVGSSSGSRVDGCFYWWVD